MDINSRSTKKIYFSSAWMLKYKRIIKRLKGRLTPDFFSLERENMCFIML
jgi:hypothetical protein